MKLFKLLLLLLLLLISCKEEQTSLSTVGQILEGKHKLKRFNVTTINGKRTSAGFFLIAGSASSSRYQETKAKFSWQLNTGEYAISELSINDIRVRIDSTVDTPYIKFHWIPGPRNNLPTIMRHYVNYIVITCKEEDYPINIDFTNL